MKSQAVRPLTAAERDLKDQLEETIRAGLTTFAEVGQALMQVRDARLYRDGYATFEDYCAGEWQISRTRGYELMGAARVVSAIADTGLPVPTNEAQARELSRVPEERRTEVWADALEATDGKPTAAAVKAAAAQDSPIADPYEAHAGVEEAGIGDAPADRDREDRGTYSTAGVGSPAVATTGRSEHDVTDASEANTFDAEQPASGVSAGSSGRGGVQEPPPRPSDVVNTPVGPISKSVADALDKHVPHPDPHGDWRAAFVKAVGKVHALMRFTAAEVAERGDDTCFDELVAARDHLDEYLDAVQRARLAGIPDNVSPIRRTA